VAGTSSWSPAGPGALGIDWSGHRQTDRFDPYVAWLDITKFPGGDDEAGGPVLIVELTRPYAAQAASHLKQLGLLVTSHYRHLTLPNGERPRYLTATCTEPYALTKLHRTVLEGDDWVARYEVSAGFASPDSTVFESGDRPPPAIDPVDGPLVGFVDYGCPFLHQSLRDKAGKPRIQALWNPLLEEDPPTGRPALRWKPNARFERGRVVDASDLEKFERDCSPSGVVLDEETAYRYAAYEAVRRFSTHGAHVMDIATGFPDRTRHVDDPGSQHEAAIVFAQLPRYVNGVQVSGLLRAQVLDAVHFVAAHVASAAPGVINLSYGSNCGPHDGTSILECALDELLDSYRDASGSQRLHIVLPSGNALDREVHAQIDLEVGERRTLRWVNVPDDPSDSFVELWVADPASLQVRVVTPDGELSPWVVPGQAVRLAQGPSTVALLIGAGRPCQSRGGALFLLAAAPTASDGERQTGPYGTWRIEVRNVGAAPVLVNAWCERDDPVFGNEAGPRQAYFVNHVEETGTLNSIAHGRFTKVVGGVHIHDNADDLAEGPVASMSGTGPGRDLAGRDRYLAQQGESRLPGPEILAPCSLQLGDEGLPGAAVLSGDEVRLTGTSVSAAYYTRRVIQNGFAPPDGDVRRLPGTIPGREAHPDDGFWLPRLP
jgi:hypothetical protein